MLIDSKVLETVEEWSAKKDEIKMEVCDPRIEINGAKPESPKAPNSEVVILAKKLIEGWSALKEVFKIPKKERIEQMKEHEREADSGFRQMTKDQVDHLYSRYKLDKDRDGDRFRDRDRERDRDRDRDRWVNKRATAVDPDWLKNHRDR